MPELFRSKPADCYTWRSWLENTELYDLTTSSDPVAEIAAAKPELIKQLIALLPPTPGEKKASAYTNTDNVHAALKPSTLEQ